MSEETLIMRAHAGDKEAARELIERFTGLAAFIAREYFVQGADEDDTRQEAVIGIWNAIRSWQPGYAASAKSFVTLCIRRHLATCALTGSRGKHRPLTESTRVITNEYGEPLDAVDALPTHGADPLDILLRREQLAELSVRLRSLTPLETRALLGVANGISYAELARVSDSSVKAIDNAMQRALAKLDSLNLKRLYRCPTCSGATVKRVAGSRGRPPRCNVCVTRDALRAAA